MFPNREGAFKTASHLLDIKHIHFGVKRGKEPTDECCHLLQNQLHHFIFYVW